MRIALIAITAGGAKLGRKIADSCHVSDFFVSSRYLGKAGKNVKSFEPTALRELITTHWNSYDGFIFIMATGIVVRMIAQLLKDKSSDPAVVVMDDAGRFSISLLSGHLGGANELAERCAFATGARAVITTATDVNDLPSFDMLAKDHGWIIDDISKVKVLNTLILDQKEIAVIDPSGKCRSWLHGRGNINYYETLAEAAKSRAEGFVCVTSHHLPQQVSSGQMLILRPCNLVLGIGCNRGTPSAEIEEFVTMHMKRLFLSMKSICCIASVTAKSDETGMIEFAKQLNVPFHCFNNDEINQVTCPSPPSAYAMAAVGVTGVAEPAAILAAGGGPLLLQKVKSPNVTLAIAEMAEA